jgi:hypothetical protein
MPSIDSIADACNLSNFYFDKSLLTQPNHPKILKPYVSKDCIDVVRIDERRGRGMIAKKDLEAGTCLFVIPPTVAVPVDKVLEQWRNESSAGNDEVRLETVAEDVLLGEMQTAIEKTKSSDAAAVANSFLVLEGHSDNVVATIPSMDCLLALDQTSIPLLQEESTVEDLRQIVRRNAFGPDFVTYSTIVRNLPTQRAHRILGLYPLADMMNHSCQPNTVRVYVGEYMVVHTSVKVAAGDEIVTSYVPPTFSYPQRHTILQQNHRFVCACHRCQVEAIFWEKPVEKVANLVELQQSSEPSISKVMDAIPFLEDEFLPSTKPNELQRSLRLGFTPLYVSYLNQALLTGSVPDEDLLRVCMQLHFGFVSCNPSSTEHLSILHLGYELIGKLHSKPGNDQSKTLPKLRFWTEQLKQACMTRYGSMGHDVDGVRRMMQHTRLVLRTPEGMQRAAYAFI